MKILNFLYLSETFMKPKFDLFEIATVLVYVKQVLPNRISSFLQVQGKQHIDYHFGSYYMLLAYFSLLAGSKFNPDGAKFQEFTLIMLKILLLIWYFKSTDIRTSKSFFTLLEKRFRIFLVFIYKVLLSQFALMFIS